MAPFDGQVLTPDLAIFLGQSTEACDERIVIETTRTASIAKVDAEYERKIWSIDRRTDDAIAKVELDDLKRQIPSWYERPIVVAAVTTGFMLVLYFVAVKTVNQAATP